MDTSGSKDFSMHASKKNTHKHIELDQIESSLRDSQKQLELEKTRLSLALDQMPAAIVIADQPTRRITNINRYCELIWKLSFKGNTIEEFDQTHQLFHLNGTPYKVEERPLARAIGETIV